MRGIPGSWRWPSWRPPPAPDLTQADAKFVVDYYGDVTRSMVFESDLEHHFVGFCARRAIENLRFDDNPFGPMTLIENWQLSFE